MQCRDRNHETPKRTTLESRKVCGNAFDSLDLYGSAFLFELFEKLFIAVGGPGEFGPRK